MPRPTFDEAVCRGLGRRTQLAPHDIEGISLTVEISPHRALHRRHVVKARWQARPLPLVSSVFALIGLLLLTYPDAASWLTQYNQSKIIKSYADQIRYVDPAPAEQIRRAHEYNRAMTAGALLEANRNLPTGNGRSTNAKLDYFALLNATSSGMMGRIKIPSINVDLPIYHGTSDETLEAGVGHLQGTHLPVGGDNTRTVLTAHRGLAHADMFTHLDQVELGDTFSVEVFGEVFVYKVFDAKVVQPEETEAIRVVPGRDLATLVTCTPLGVNTHRILLTGERVEPTPRQALEEVGTPPTIPTFPWWAVWLVGGLVLIGLYTWRSGYPVVAGLPAPRSQEDHSLENGEASAASDGNVDCSGEAPDSLADSQDCCHDSI